MSLSVLKSNFLKVGKGLLLGVLCFFGLVLWLLVFDSKAAVFESRESKTVKNTEVFNEISFQPGWKSDVWVMRQSHQGLDPSLKKSNWDRVAIVVNKEEKTAQFYQLVPGSTKWSKNTPTMNYKISCYFCHSNGPRAIRPNWSSKFVNNSFFDKAKVLAWNLRIKSYGRLLEKEVVGEVPLRISGVQANQKLEVKVCTTCHNDSGNWFSRGSISKQNYSAVKFMLDNKQMPPPGFDLSASEGAKIKSFFFN